MRSKLAGSAGQRPRLTNSRRRFLFSAAAAWTYGILPTPRLVRAAAEYPSLQGKTITILVGSEVGGNYDLFARSIGRHFERVVRDIRIQVKNIPQAGGALAAKTLQVGPTDGTMLLTSSTGLLGAQIQGDESVAYDLASWSWLGRLATESRLLVIGSGADIADLDELRAKSAPSTMSVRSKSSYSYYEAMWLNAILGLRIKPVPGYKNIERENALVQGEVMLTVIGFPTDREVLDQQGVDVLLRLTEGPALPSRFADRPLLADLIADQRSFVEIAAFMRASTSMQNWMAAPPDTPADILAEWRRVFDSAATSPAYLDEASKLGFNVSLVRGSDLQQQISHLVANIGTLRPQLEAAARCGEILSDGGEAACAAF